LDGARLRTAHDQVEWGAVARDIKCVQYKRVLLYMSNWHGIWAPKSIAPAARDKLRSAIAETLADAAVRKRLVDLGQEIAPAERQTPDGLAALHKSDLDKWLPIIRRDVTRLEKRRDDPKASRLASPTHPVRGAPHYFQASCTKLESMNLSIGGTGGFMSSRLINPSVIFL
jgi:hypothetical protein